MGLHPVAFIQDLTVIMLLAGIMTVICYRIKQPAVLGYILAGTLIGPSTPDTFLSIHDNEIIKTFSELGIIFLLFSLGLEFNLRRLWVVGKTALVTAFTEIIFMMVLGYAIGRLIGWSNEDALFLGALISISSTTIIAKALSELDLKHQLFSQLIFGILVVEDIFAIIIIALLSSFAADGIFDVANTLVIAGQLLLFLLIALITGIFIVPRILSYVARFNSHEMLLITTLALCFGFCFIVVQLDYSIALGAFLMGAMIAESKQLPIIEKATIPLREMFSAIFFVSVGLLLDIHVVAPYYLIILLITAAVIIGKVISCSVGVYITGHNAKTAVRVGMGLSQIGEFSFIIATLGMSLHATSDTLYPIAVAVSAITTLTTPYLLKYSDTVTDFILLRQKN